MKKMVSIFFYISLYSLALSLSFSAFMLFRPFSYVNNDHSYIRCLKDGINYETSPNLIFALDKKLDPFNDKKAKKLCEYQIISDYVDLYQAPEKQNYTFLPAFLPESSWPNALFAFLLTYLVGSSIIEALRKIIGLNEEYYFGSYLWKIMRVLID